MTDDLDTLRPEVQAAIRTMSGEAAGNRDDAYDVIEAELRRLARENDEWQTRCLQFQTERDMARAELAALKARIADSPIASLVYGQGDLLAAISAENPDDWAGKRVRLVVEE